MDSSPYDPVHGTDEQRNDENATTPSPNVGIKRKGGGASKGKKKNTSTRADVWEHYTRLPTNYDKYKCNYCAREMTCPTSSGTSNLRKHLTVCRLHLTWLSSKKQTQHVLESEGDEGALVLGKVSDDVVKEATNEMIALGELPLCFVESVAWRHFCNRVKFKPPHSRRTATREIVKMYAKRKASMHNMFASSKQRVSFTTDIWVAPSTAASYMVITAHWIDSNWLLRKLILGFKNVIDHKGLTIARVLEECLAEWGIKKIFTITVDNATANTNALKIFAESYGAIANDALVLDGRFLNMRCAAHILNLVVRDGLKEVDVCAIRNAITYVRSSTPRLNSFEFRVLSGKMSRGSLPLDCKTRWNSTYLMLSKALKFRLAFDKMEAEDKLYNEYFEETVSGKKIIGPPTSDDWDAVERTVRFLVIFYNSTLVVSASTSVNSYKCYTEIVTIERNLIKLSNDPDVELRKRAMAMRKKFDKYWEELKKINRLLIVTRILDPRNKMRFASLCFEWVYCKDSVETKALQSSVADVLKSLFEEYTLRYVTANGDEVAGTQSQSGATSSQSTGQDVSNRMDLDTDVGYERMDFVYKEMIDEIGIEDESNEVEIYLKDKVETTRNSLPGSKYDVLGWWKVNEHKYPVLCATKDVLAMQVSSVASESAFSTSGRVLDPYRSCLTHYMIEVLLCTEQWMRSDIHLRERASIFLNNQLMIDVEQQDKLFRSNVLFLYFFTYELRLAYELCHCLV